MRLFFEDTHVTKRLARQLQREARSLGKEIKLSSAHNLVAKAFGYRNYDDLHAMIGYGDPSEPDKTVSQEEQAQRFAQYVDALSQSEFTREQAIELLQKARSGSWWEGSHFPETEAEAEAEAELEVRASENKTQFRDELVVAELFSTFRMALRSMGVSSQIPPRRLFAKLFGHEGFVSLLECAGQAYRRSRIFTFLQRNWMPE